VDVNRVISGAGGEPKGHRSRSDAAIDVHASPWTFECLSRERRVEACAIQHRRVDLSRVRVAGEDHGGNRVHGVDQLARYEHHIRREGLYEPNHMQVHVTRWRSKICTCDLVATNEFLEASDRDDLQSTSGPLRPRPPWTRLPIAKPIIQTQSYWSA
jgi:hypothetical protein